MPAVEFHTHPLPPKARPIDVEWSCRRSGDCCTVPREVVMTVEEMRHILRKVPVGIQTEWRQVDERLMALKTGPCPFYVFKTCLIYADRPYTCRRFACMRPDPKTEPFEEATSESGCANVDGRLHNKKIRRMLLTIQRRAQRWGRRFGWENI